MFLSILVVPIILMFQDSKVYALSSLNKLETKTFEIVNDSISFLTSEFVHNYSLNLDTVTQPIKNSIYQNYLNLSWSFGGDSQKYAYRVFRKAQGENKFMNISSSNFQKPIKVLNLYPGDVGQTITFSDSYGQTYTLQRDAQAKMWEEMPQYYSQDFQTKLNWNETKPQYLTDDSGNTIKFSQNSDGCTVQDNNGIAIPSYMFDSNGNIMKDYNGDPVPNRGFGMGRVIVTPVDIDDFNNNPNQYLFNSDGSYNYDVIYAGAWDCNNSRDLSDTGEQAIESFINSGRGYLMGHDTDALVIAHTNFAKLDKYVGLKQISDASYFYANTNIYKVKTGLLNTYPWDLTANNFTIPLAHTTGQFATGDVWFKFSGPNEWTQGNGIDYGGTSLGPTTDGTTTEGGTNNFYLTTYNNTAMIQTGHSEGQATPDEQKILTNTLFYLSQLVDGTSMSDYSANDKAAPDTPTIKGVNANNSGNINFNVASKDNGTNYTYYVETAGYNNDEVTTSNQQTGTVTTGLSGYYYSLDTNSNNTISSNKSFSSSPNITVKNIPQQMNLYFHVAAVDRAGNISNVTTYTIKNTVPTGSYNLNSHYWTNQGVTTVFTPYDSGSGVKNWQYQLSKDNGATWGSWSNNMGSNGSSIALSGQGQWRIRSLVTNNIGNSSTIISGTYNIDTTFPTGIFNPNSCNWTNNSITATFTPNDQGGSGVENWRYRISKDNGNSWESWSGYIGNASQNITLNGQGQWKIQSDVIDNAGNESFITSDAYSIDTTAPTGTYNPNSSNWTNQSITTTFTPQDQGGSGIKSWQYQLSKDNGITWGSWSNNMGSNSSLITLSGQGQWKIRSLVTDNAGNTTTITSGIYDIDITVPTGTFTANSSTWTYKDVTTTFTPQDQGGSGVKNWQSRISKDGGNTWSTWSEPVGNYSQNIVLSGAGQYKIQCLVYDNAGNFNVITSGEFDIFNPNPINITPNVPNTTPSKNNVDLKVVQYDYKQDDYNYWVKPNSIIGIYTDGFFESKYGLFPTRTYLYLAKNGEFENNTSTQYADLNNHYEAGSEYLNNFNFINNGDRANNMVLDGKNYIDAIQRLTAKYDGMKYKLLYTTSFIDNNLNEFKQGYTDSNQWIHVDGVAPGFDSLSDYENGKVSSSLINSFSLDSNLNINGTVENLSDKGSGIKSVYAEITSSSDSNNVKQIQLVNENGNWVLPKTNPYTLFNLPYGIDIKIHAVDNVGNDGVIYSKHFDLLTVSATLTPDPAKEGQLLHFNISTTGFADMIIIDIPQEIKSSDTSGTQFPITKSIPEVASILTKQDFTIPEKTPITIDDNGNRIGQPYNVTIVATREDGKQVQCTVPLDVKDNVLDGLKTEILDHNLTMK